MPKSKRHSVKTRYNKSRKTRRGGGKDPLKKTSRESKRDASEIEEGRKYGDISAPALFDPKKFDKKQTPSSRLTYYTPEETASFIEERETASREYDKLMRKHQEAAEKDVERKRVQQSFLTPSSAEETARFFATTNMNDEADEDDCEGGVCNIMGGRKSRRRRRKGHKTRKRRKSRR